MNQAQLTAALNGLKTAIAEGEAELKAKPEQLALIKNLYAELKRLKPGQTPAPKTIAALRQFLTTHLDDEIAEQTSALEKSKQRGGPVVAQVTEAQSAALQALEVARQSVGALDPNTPAQVVADAGVRMANSNQTADEAVKNAEAAQAFVPRKK